MRMKHRAALLLLLGLLPGLAGVAVPADEGSDDQRQSLPEPSFRPGASLAWELELKAPSGWHINYLLPVAVSFDREQLKGLPVSLAQERFEFELKDYAESYKALIPLQVSPKAADGEYKLPAQVDCGICTEDNSACTFGGAEASVLLRVRQSAPKSEKNQAQPKGILRSSAGVVQSE